MSPRGRRTRVPNAPRRAVSLWVLAAVLVGWVSVTSAPASAECNPPTVTVVGAPSTKSGVTVAYPSTLVTIKGSGWSLCTGAQPGGCGSGSRPPPINSIRVEIAHARAATSMSHPETWQIGRRDRRLGVFDASEDGTFSIPSVPMPSEPGRYVIAVSIVGEHQWRVFGWVTIL